MSRTGVSLTAMKRDRADRLFYAVLVMAPAVKLVGAAIALI